MSRIGKQVLNIPAGVEVNFTNNSVSVKGPKGTLVRDLRDEIEFKIEGSEITSAPRRNDKFSRSIWGTYMSHLQNMLKGVTEGFEKKLLVEGVGYKWEVKGKQVQLNMGFSHPVMMDIPEGLAIKAEKGEMTISGIDKEMVSSFAMKVRKVKMPEPYKGKGIRYAGEFIIRKQGKKGVA